MRNHTQDANSISGILNDFLICIIYNKNTRWSNGFIKDSCLCAADFDIVKFNKFGLDYTIAPDLKTALRHAKIRRKKYIIYMQVGNVVDWSIKLANNLSNLMQQGYTFAGHILDYGNGSFYIHPQFFIMDAKWARKNDIDTILPEDKDVNWQGHAIDRSEENFHDHYTPKWTKSNGNIQNFQGRGNGWNILDKLSEQKKQFTPLPENIRNTKWFLYPTVKQESARIKAKIIDWSYNTGVYVANTEALRYNSYRNTLEKYNGKIDRVMLPASGALSMIMPYMLKAREVILYDSSDTAIQFANDLKTWDGKDYKDFVNSKNYHDPKGQDYLEFDQDYLEKQGLPFIEWWLNMREHVNVQKINILNEETYKSFVRSLTDIPTVVSISNIMHYHHNQLTYRTHELPLLIQDFQRHCLKNISKENFNIVGLNPYSDIKLHGLLDAGLFKGHKYDSVPWRYE